MTDLTLEEAQRLLAEHEAVVADITRWMDEADVPRKDHTGRRMALPERCQWLIDRIKAWDADYPDGPPKLATAAEMLGP